MAKVKELENKFTGWEDVPFLNQVSRKQISAKKLVENNIKVSTIHTAT